MEQVFFSILNMSIKASWLVLAVVVLRFLLKKVPKSFIVVMWALVGIRLICPFFVESSLSLIPSVQIIQNNIAESEMLGNKDDNLGSGGIADYYLNMNENDEFRLVSLFSGIWLFGMILILTYSFISWLRLYRKVQISILYEENIYFCDTINNAFILGIIRANIYIPSGIDKELIYYIKAHEYAHLERKDHWWKFLGFVLLAVYWFNPVIWVAYILLCRDIEMACDEKVIKNMDTQEKKGYSNALAVCALQPRNVLVCPLAFGEIGVKERVKVMKSYKKPTFWIIVIGVVVCVALAIGFLTNPIGNENYTPYYGGAYIDEDGKCIVLLTKINESIIKSYEATGEFDDCEYKKCDITYSELTKLYEEVSEGIATFKTNKNLAENSEWKDLATSISGLGIYTKRSRVVVSIVDCTDIKIALFKENINDSKYIEFENSTGYPSYD